MTRQLSFLFPEEESLIGTAGDVLKCDGHRVVLDTETTGLEWWRDQTIGFGIYCPEIGISKYIPVTTDSDRLEVELAVQKIASNPETTIVGHHLKFDAHFSKLHLWKFPCRIEDSIVAAHLYDSRLEKKLGALELVFLGARSKHSHIGKVKGTDIKNMPLGAVAAYCVNDCRIVYDLLEVLKPKLEELKLLRLFDKDMRFLRLLQKVEQDGMVLDYEFIDRAMKRFIANLQDMETEFYSKIPTELKGTNWRSDVQLSSAIYEGLGIARPKNPFADADGVDRTKFATRGKYNKTATSAFLLMEKGHHPLGELIMDMRETDKLKDNLEQWLELADKNGVIHTNFNLTGTRTGRLSSSKPNLQNVASDVRVRHTQSVYSGGAIRADEYNLRLAFKSRPEYKFLSIDYRQQEMKMFAILAKEPEMMEALKRREDIHSMIAKAVWAEDIAKDPECLKIRREWSKTLGFGLIYGMTTGSLQHRMNKTPEEAKKIVGDYQNRFPRIMPFLQETIRKCKKDGYVRYWSGRIWREQNEQDMYKGANALVQGGSADLLSIAAMRTQTYLEEQGSGRLASLIHDELLFEIEESKVEQTAVDISKMMEVEDLLKVPFATEYKIGDSYGGMHAHEGES